MALLISGPVTPLFAESDEMVITVGGDTMIGRYMGPNLRVHGGDDPFKEISSLLGKGDLTIINVETPITDHIPLRIRRGRNLRKHSVTFRMPLPYAALMAQHGVDFAILANNHAEDCGVDGARETLDVLDAAGIKHVGGSADGDPFASRRISVGTSHVNILALTLFRNAGNPRPGQKLPVAYMPYSKVKKWMPERVAKMRSQFPNDIIVASLHWGRQYSEKPSRGQVSLARALVDAGADIVLGHHPHVLQPVEVYRKGLILYSLGNLVFDQIRADARKSAVFHIQMKRGAGERMFPVGLTMVPIQLRKVSKGPRPASASEAKSNLLRIQAQSKKRFKTRLELSENQLVWKLNASF